MKDIPQLQELFRKCFSPHIVCPFLFRIGKSPVSCKQNPSLQAGYGEELSVFQVPEISDIVPQNPQPSCQLSQHAIGKKTRRFHRKYCTMLS